MYQTNIDAAAAVATVGPAARDLFTPLEQAVLDLARNERGRGLLPETRLGRTLERVSLLFGGHVIRPLADPRLEALRMFVNALHRRGRARIEATATTLRSAGFDALQESWIRSAHPHPA